MGTSNQMLTKWINKQNLICWNAHIMLHRNNTNIYPVILHSPSCKSIMFICGKNLLSSLVCLASSISYTGSGISWCSLHISENHNIEVDLDLAGDLAQLKRNLAKLRKGRHGRGLGDILIEEIDWVGTQTKGDSNSIMKSPCLDTKWQES